VAFQEPPNPNCAIAFADEAHCPVKTPRRFQTTKLAIDWLNRRLRSFLPKAAQALMACPLSWTRVREAEVETILLCQLGLPLGIIFASVTL
jgi:hypothetical protein